MASAPGEDPLAHVRERYDRWAAVYDHDENPLTALEEPHVRKALGDVRGKRVLDLGCGTGRHTLWLADQGAVVTAVDFSEGMLREAEPKIGPREVELVRHDLNQPLPFPDQAFDVVVSGLVLEHLKDLDAFFREARRVASQEGRAVISAMHPAMFLRGSQARFTDPESGELIQPGSIDHSLGQIVMGAITAGFGIAAIQELSPDQHFATLYPRAVKYVGWPMLVVLELRVL